MTEKKDLWWVLPVSLALLVLIAASGAANFIYGLDFGGPIIGGVSIASDLIKVVALIGVFSLWRNRHWLQASALMLLFVGFTVWSMISAVGFISSKFSTLQDTRGKTASAWQELTGEIDRLKAQREKVLDVRPQATIQAEINSILRIPGVNGCATIDGPVTRQHCPKFGELKAELGHAERAIWLDGKLETLRSELKKTDRVTVVDPRTDSLAAFSGAGAASVILFVKFFIALLVEAATAFGLWAVWSPFFGKKRFVPEKPQEAAVATKAPAAPSPRGGTKQPVLPSEVREKLASYAPRSEVTPKLPEPVKPFVISDNTPKLMKNNLRGSVKEWIAERTEKTSIGGAMTGSLHTDYVAWCKEHRYNPLDVSHFGRKLNKIGIKREGRNKGSFRPGIKLRTEVAARKVAAA